MRGTTPENEAGRLIIGLPRFYFLSAEWAQRFKLGRVPCGQAEW